MEKSNKLHTSNGTSASVCPIQKKCGGCQYLTMSYEAQLAQKQKQLQRLLGKYGKIKPIAGMYYPYHYRNKVNAAFGHDKKGNPISGIYEAGSHRIVPNDCCLIEDKRADAIIVTIRSLLKSFKIKTYDEDTGYGLLRHVMVRTAHATGEILVVLVTASPIFPSKNNFVKALRKQHPEITSIVQNINDKHTSMVLGEREQVLFGKGYIEDVLCGCRFRISPCSFYQVNAVQTEVLYKKAIAAAGLTGTETVIDAYCGIGTIGMAMAQKAGQVIGVELNPDAVRDAISNARQNRISNIRFYCQDAGQFIEQLAAARQSADVVVMDPPRSGSSEQFLTCVVSMKPKRIVYVSCNPETLARDLEFLTKRGYAVSDISPVDMFPWTEHVETVCLLSKLHTKQNIEVELKMSEMDLTAAESKATYEEIKDYVLEYTGLKVSSLYIAQVKKKCGIIERKNYNKEKSENAKQPQCPPEKEKVIKEALRHFGMI